MELDPTKITFLVLAALTTVSAFRVVTTPRLMHAALWLGLTFVMLAGVFLTLGAEFLAAAQVLIYVGAVTTIILFGVMLSEAADVRGRVPTPEGAAPPGTKRGGLLPVLAVAAFAGIMIFVYRQVPWPGTAAGFEADTVSMIGRALFTDFVIPFELAAVLLLVALVGAIVIAVRDDVKEEESR